MLADAVAVGRPRADRRHSRRGPGRAPTDLTGSPAGPMRPADRPRCSRAMAVAPTIRAVGCGAVHRRHRCPRPRRTARRAPNRVRPSLLPERARRPHRTRWPHPRRRRRPGRAEDGPKRTPPPGCWRPRPPPRQLTPQQTRPGHAPPPGEPNPGTSGRPGMRSRGSTPAGGPGPEVPVGLLRNSGVDDPERSRARRGRPRRRRTDRRSRRPRSASRVRSRRDHTEVNPLTDQAAGVRSWTAVRPLIWPADCWRTVLALQAPASSPPTPGRPAS